MSQNTGIHQIDVRFRKLQAMVGLPAFADWLNRVKNLVNSAGAGAEVWTVTVDAFTGGATYAFLINGVEFSIVELGGANVNDVATQIRAAWNASPIGRGYATAGGAGADVVLTGNWPSIEFEVDTSGDAQLTAVETTPAADAESIEPGRAMIGTGYTAQGISDAAGSVENGALARSSALTAQVDTWTVAGFTAGSISWSGIVMGDQHVSATVPFDTNIDTSLDNLAAAIDAALAGLGLTSLLAAVGPSGAPGAGEIVLTAALAGVDFEGSCIGSTGTAALVSNRSRATSILRSFKGLTILRYDNSFDDENPTSNVGPASYEPNATVALLREGLIWVERSGDATAPAIGGRVFLDLSAGAEAGRFHTLTGAGRVPLPFAMMQWERDARQGATDGLALLNLGSY